MDLQRSRHAVNLRQVLRTIKDRWKRQAVLDAAALFILAILQPSGYREHWHWLALRQNLLKLGVVLRRISDQVHEKVSTKQNAFSKYKPFFCCLILDNFIQTIFKFIPGKIQFTRLLTKIPAWAYTRAATRQKTILFASYIRFFPFYVLSQS